MFVLNYKVYVEFSHYSNNLLDNNRYDSQSDSTTFLPFSAYYKPREARGQLVLRLLCCFHVCLCVHTYHVCNNYVTNIVAMWPYFNWLWQLRRLLCVATMISLAQLRVQDSYEFEMDTEKQRQRRCKDARLTESRNARSKQLLLMPRDLLTNREWLPGEFLSGSERRRPGWLLDMKYPTCFWTSSLSWNLVTNTYSRQPVPPWLL